MTASDILPDLGAAIRLLTAGGVLIFPTETFYAAGCLARDAKAVSRVFALKARDHGHPLPLIAASAEQVGATLDAGALPESLAAFWPGPLTVLLPVLSKNPPLPEGLVNPAHEAAVRVSPHPTVRALAAGAGGLLTASSANISGCAPACRCEGLDPRFTARLSALDVPFGILAARGEEEQPAGGLPSTIVKPLRTQKGAIALRVLRHGAISDATLANAGFALLPA